MTWTTPTTPATGTPFSIAGRWNPEIRDNLIHLHDLAALYVLNSSGVTIADGAAVAVSTAADLVILTTAAVGDARVIGVAQGNILDGESGYVIVLGRVNNLRVTGAVTRQAPLQTSGTAQYAQSGAGNSFATALSAVAGPGTGSVSAFIHNRGSLAAHVIQDEGSNLAQRSKLNFLGAGVTATDNAGADSTDVTIPGAPAVEPDYLTALWFGGN